MQIIRGMPILASHSEITHPTSTAQPSQKVHVFIEGESCKLSIGSHDNRQQIKALFEQFSYVTPTQTGQPHFSAATGEQKAAVKALNPAWFLTK